MGHEFIRNDVEIKDLHISATAGTIEFDALGWILSNNETLFSGGLALYDAATNELHLGVNQFGFRIDTYNDAVGHGVFNTRASRGSKAAPAYLNNGDTLVEYRGTPIKNTGTSAYTAGAANLKFVASAAHSVDSTQTAAELWLTPASSATPELVLTIDQPGTGLTEFTALNHQFNFGSTGQYYVNFSGDLGGYVQILGSTPLLHLSALYKAGLGFGANISDVIYTGVEISELGAVTLRGANNEFACLGFSGTVDSMEQLDDTDQAGILNFLCLDDGTTWTGGASIRTVATADHDTGETPAAIEFWTTPLATDTQAFTARIDTYVLLPGVLDVPVPTLTTRAVTFLDYGSDVGFGYFTDLVNGFGIPIPDGVVMFNLTSATASLMLGIDGCIYQAADGTNVYTDDQWRTCVDASNYYVISQYDEGLTAWDDVIYLTENGLNVNDGLSTCCGGTLESHTDVSSTPTDLTIKTGTAKTVVLDTPVYNDINFAIGRGNIPGANYPNYTAFNGATYLKEYQFGLNEYIELNCEEITHDWKQETALKPHVHIVLSDTLSEDEKVQFRLYYSRGKAGGAMSAEAYVDGEKTIASGTAAGTHILVELADITMAGYEIGTQFDAALMRIAKSAGGVELSDEPWVVSIGLHYQIDTIGSRTATAK